MPLLVQCPRGCEVRMSRNRAGRIVRCPSCKCAMRVPVLTQAQQKMGGVIPCRAKIARRRRIDPEEQARQQQEIIKRADKQLEAIDPVDDAVQDTTPVVVPKLILPVIPGQSEEDVSAESKNESGDEASQLEIPKPVYKKSRVKKAAAAVEADIAAAVDAETAAEKSNGRSHENPTPVSLKPESTNPEPYESSSIGSKPSSNSETERETEQETEQEEEAVQADLAVRDPELEPSTSPEIPLPAGLVARKAAAVEERIELGRNIPRPPAIPQIDLNAAAPTIQQDRDWEGRLGRANSDRRLLARFFALCLCFVAIVNMVPAVYHWYHWAQQTESAALPRWIYIQVFVGALHLIYALFLAQIPDWSAMRAVSIALLFMAFLFGVVSTGLLVGGTGDLSGFLGIPFTLNREACIWCVAMLSLATLMAYWGGKEAANWQRAEYLLKDIMAKPAA